MKKLNLKIISALGGTVEFNLNTSAPSYQTMYIVNIFQESGAAIDPYWGAVVVGACRLAASICSSVALKHVCRRKLFLR